MKKLWLLLIPLGIVVLDQWVKHWTVENIGLYMHKPFLPGFLGLTHLRNEGAGWGLLSGHQWLLVAVSTLALGFAVFAVVKGYVTHGFGLVSLAGLVGGGLGNLIDRAAQGYVVDTFEFMFIDFPIFNIADIFVVVFGILFCIYWLKFHEHSPGKTDEPAADTGGCEAISDGGLDGDPFHDDCEGCPGDNEGCPGDGGDSRGDSL